MANNFLSLIKNKLFKNLLIFSFVFLTIIMFFPETLYKSIIAKNFLSFHIIIEFCIIFFSLAIAVQIGLVSKYDLKRRTVILGAVFFTMAMLEIGHILTYTGMPFLFREPNPNTSSWLSFLAKLFLIVGLIITFLIKDKKIVNFYRHYCYAIATVITSLTVFLMMQFGDYIPLFHVDGTPYYYKQFLHVALIIILLIAITIILKTANLNNIITLVYITSFIYFITGELMILFFNGFFDKYIFLSHIINLLAFGFLFFSMYYLRIREPFDELTKTNQFLLDSEEKIKQLAYYDEVTKLPNDRKLKEWLEESLHPKNQEAALIVLEITKYELIKSSLGVEIANYCKKIVGERLTNFFLKNDTVFNLTENQFAIIMNQFENEDYINSHITQLKILFKEPIVFNQFSIPLDIRVGVSIYNGDANNASQLIEHATFAVFEAKKSHNLVEYYQTKLHKNEEERLILENDLQCAFPEQLYLEYQPQLDLNDNEIHSIEALIRWKHPLRGNISPQEFIPIAERNGLIIPIGQWVLEQACMQTMELRERTGIDYTVAVNLSVSQLFQKDFCRVVCNIIEMTGLPAINLQLEITESMTVNREDIIPILSELKMLGVSIAIDDFGTGYSSLSYLKDFPIDVLKIDRSFIQNLFDNEKNEQLVKMMVTLAKQLQLKVVAEGIETEEQLEILSQLDCDKIQGYLISKPVRMDKFMSQFHV